MIPCETFTYGLIGNSIKFQPSSPKVKELLKPQSLDYLTGLTLKRKEKSRIIEKYLPTEQLITVTHLYRDLDSFGRPTVINKTYILTLDDYMVAYPPHKLIEEYTCTKF